MRLAWKRPSSAGLVMAAAVLAAAVLAVFAAKAFAAGSVSYCGYLVNARTACGDQPGTIGYQVHRNEANYYGSGTVSVCEKLLNSPYNYQMSRVCQNNHADSDVDHNKGYLHKAAICIVGNDSAYRHTIHGYCVWHS